mmetsp:Transcript_1655/g.7224  ORF Transcript_1655/g.7224 Transcript_1655/m.7224 type:complete len:272 (+) Transcript_1655:3282-4097(+)
MPRRELQLRRAADRESCDRIRTTCSECFIVSGMALRPVGKVINRVEIRVDVLPTGGAGTRLDVDLDSDVCVSAVIPVCVDVYNDGAVVGLQDELRDVGMAPFVNRSGPRCRSVLAGPLMTKPARYLPRARRSDHVSLRSKTCHVVHVDARLIVEMADQVLRQRDGNGGELQRGAGAFPRHARLRIQEGLRNRGTALGLTEYVGVAGRRIQRVLQYPQPRVEDVPVPCRGLRKGGMLWWSGAVTVRGVCQKRNRLNRRICVDERGFIVDYSV